MAGLVATFCLLGQFSTLAHNVLIRHATCAEHGELVHQSTEAEAPTDVAARFAHVALRASDAGGPAEGHGHDHCLAAAHGRGHVGLGATAASAIADRALPEPLLFEARPVRSTPDALYRLAPKTSPPA